MKRLEELERTLTENCTGNCEGCPYDKECTEYAHIGRYEKLSFKWESGSLNDNAIKSFKKNGIKFEYDRYFNLVALFRKCGTFEKVEYINAGNDIYIPAPANL